MLDTVSSLFSKAYRILKNDGVVSLSRSVYSFGKSTLPRLIRNKIFYPKKERFNIAGHEAVFFMESLQERESIVDTIQPEKKPLEYLLNNSDKDDIFLDIGGHLGVYSCFIGMGVKRTYSFEPHPKNIERLKQNMGLNNVNANIFPIGLSNRSTEADLILDGKVMGELGATVSHSNHDERHTTSIDLEIGDELLQKESIVPNIIKIDVEGEEYEVVEGLKSTLKKDKCRLLYLEIHHRGGKADIQERGHKKEDITNMLEGFGYELNTFDIYSGGTQIIAEK